MLRCGPKSSNLDTWGYYFFVVIIQLLSHVRSLWPPWAWTAAQKVFLSFNISQSLLRLISIESVMPSNHVIICLPLFLLTSVLPSIRAFSNESALCIRWPKYYSFSISPSNEYSGLISFRINCLFSLPTKGLSRVFSSTRIWKHQFLSAQLYLWSN